MELEYNDITLAAIANRAGFTRANVYRYFPTREEIFLKMHTQATLACAESMATALNTLDLDAPDADIAEALLNAILEQELFIGLAPLLGAVLEKGSSPEAVLEAKLTLIDAVGDVHKALARLKPNVTERATGALLMYIHALGGALWPATQPCAALAEALDHPTIAALHVDFLPLMRRAVTSLLKDVEEPL